MKNRMAVVALFLVLGAGCKTNEYTGRKQLMLVNEDTERQLGVTSYQEVLGQQPISTDPQEVEPVRRVGRRIAEAAAQSDFQWEFNTIVDDGTLNAWCLPGGKIAFYTGIFPVLEDEAGMAFVMGHEVGHALMHHGAERMSQNMVAGGAASLAGSVLGAKDSKTSEAALAAFGAATNVGVLLPFSRKHEAESDRVGLELMAKAGYDPRAAVRVWKKMAAMGGKQPPEWLSTHPSHESRIQDMEARLPEALAIYERSAKAPVAKLPPIDQRTPKGGKASPGAALIGGGSASVLAAPAREVAAEDGRRKVQIELQFDRDVYVRTVEIAGPKIGKKEIAVNQGVPGGQRRVLSIPAEDVGGPGSYSLTFHGSASGRAFTAHSQQELR